MKNRLLLYYSLFIPWFLLSFFRPDIIQVFFELFIILATFQLPYPGDFLKKSLKKLPAFSALMLVVCTVFLGLMDFSAFLSTFNVYGVLFLLVPLWLAFRLLTLPWVFIKKSLAAPITAFKSPPEANWTVLAVFSTLGLIYSFVPVVIPFLMAPASILLHERLVKSGNL